MQFNRNIPKLATLVAASAIALVAVGFLATQHGNLLDPYSIFEHMLTPALVITDRLLVGTDRNVAR